MMRPMMRLLVTGLVLAAGLLLALHAAARLAAPGDYLMQAREVAPGVYAVASPARDLPNPENKGWNANLAFVVTGDGVLVVDTGSSEVIGTALREAIRGVTDQPVRWIVNTHAHGDHWLGNAALAGGDTEVIASPAVRERIEREAERWIGLFDQMTDGATGRSRVVLPNTLVEEHTLRRLGNVPVEIIPSGDAHSPGDLVVWLPEQRVVITGDVVYSDRAPSVFDADVPQLIDFLAELEALQPRVVIPGHGSVADAAALTRLRGFMERLWAVVAEGFEAGLADFEIVPIAQERMADLREAYQGFDEKIARSVNEVYQQVEQRAF